MAFETRAYGDLSVANAKLAGSIALAKLASGTDGQFVICNGSGVPTFVSLSGDIAISNAGVASISAGVIVDADVNASAAIALTKLAAVTADRALVSSGSGFVTASAVTATELGYLSGVTSGVQAQINALVTGYNRRKKVLDYIVDNTLAPPTEVSGDRYILSHDGGAPNAAWDGATAGQIVEFNGSVWVATTPVEGWVVYDDDSNNDFLYVDDGTGQWEERAVTSTALTDGKIWIGNGSNVAAEQTVSGDITLSNTGVAAIASGVIVNADISASAGIALSKLESISEGYLLVGPTSGGAPAAVALSGDISITAAGVASIAAGVIVDADINASAAISLSKLAAGSSAQIIVANGSGVPTYVAMSGDVTISNAGVTAIGSAKVTNDMLAGSIADSKLLQITTANKVAGSAVQLAAEASIADATGLKGLKLHVEKITLSAGQITAQAVTLANTPYNNVAILKAKGLGECFIDVDFSVSGTTLSFLGELATSGARELVAGDVLHVYYQYL